MIHPRARLFSHDSRQSIGLSHVHVDIPPRANHQRQHRHRSNGATFPFCRRAINIREAEHERQKETVKRDRALTHDRQPRKDARRKEMTPRDSGQNESSRKMINAAHHEGVAVNVPRGSAAHENDVVARAEQERRDEGVGVEDLFCEAPEVEN